MFSIEYLPYSTSFTFNVFDKKFIRYICETGSSYFYFYSKKFEMCIRKNIKINSGTSKCESLFYKQWTINFWVPN